MTEQVQKLKINELEIDPANVRRMEWEGNDRELVQSIEEKGVVNPILVRPADNRSEKSYWIIQGSRRFNASIDAGKDIIPGIVKEDIDDVEARELSFMENEQRSNLSGLEKAIAVKEQWDAINGDLEKSKKYKYFKQNKSWNLSQRQVDKFLNIADSPDMLKALLGDPEAEEMVDENVLKEVRENVEDKLSTNVELTPEDLDRDTLEKLNTQLDSLDDEDVVETALVVSTLSNQKNRAKVIGLKGGEGLDVYDSLELVKQVPDDDEREEAVNLVKQGMSVEEAIEEAQKVPLTEEYTFKFDARTARSLRNAAMDTGNDRETIVEKATQKWLKENDYYE